MWLAAFSSSSVSKKTVRERADPALAVDERELAEPGRAVVLRRDRAQRVRVSSASIADGPAALELDAQPSIDRAVELERPRRAHVPVDAQRVGRREDLLAREVREVARPSTVVKSAACQWDERKRPTVRSVPGPWRWIASKRRSDSARRHASSVAHPRRSTRRPGRPRRGGRRGRSPARGGRTPRRARVRIDELGPGGRRRRGDTPVRGAEVDDVARLRAGTAAGRSRSGPGDAVERVGACGPLSVIRAACSSERYSQPVDHPRRDVVERRLGSAWSSRSRLTQLVECRRRRRSEAPRS